MSDKTYVLSLSADTFNAFKMDFDSGTLSSKMVIVSAKALPALPGSRATAPPSTAKSAWH